MNVHCTSCKKQTKTACPRAYQTNDNRFKIKGGCLECGKKKNQFVSEKLIHKLLKRKEKGGYPHL